MSVVLAVERDPAQAEILRDALRGRAGVDLVIVTSRTAAIAAMKRQVPDLVLLTTLLSPRDEDALVAHLRSIPNAAHLQTVTIPQLRRAGQAEKKAGRFSFGKKKAAAPTGVDPQVFADEVAGYLARAKEIREEARALGAVAAAAEPTPTAPLDPASDPWEPYAVTHTPPAASAVPAVDPLADLSLAPDVPPVAHTPVEPSFTNPDSFSVESEVDRIMRELGVDPSRIQIENPGDDAILLDVTPEPMAPPMPTVDVARLQAEAEARAQADAEARLAAEMDRIRAEADAKLEAERVRARAEADAKLEAERERARAEADAKVQAERERARAEAEAKLEAERERARAEAEAKLEAERERARAEAEAERERARAEAEAKLKAERERARAEAEAERERARAEAEAERKRAREEAEARARAEEEARARAEAERERARAEAEARARAEEEARARAEAEAARARAEAEARAREEEARARAEAEARARAEAEARARAEAEARARAEAEARARAEAEARARAEEELRARAAAEARLAQELERVRAEAEQRRIEELSKLQAEAEALRANSIEQARAAAEAEARSALAAELARVRAEAETEIARVQGEAEHKIARVQGEAEETFAQELQHVRAQAERALADELARARADKENARQEQLARALENEVARVRADADARLQAELDRVRREAEHARLADQAELDRIRREADERLAAEVAALRADAERNRGAELDDIRAQVDAMREAAAQQARSAAAEAVAAEVARARMAAASGRSVSLPPTGDEPSQAPAANYYKLWQRETSADPAAPKRTRVSKFPTLPKLPHLPNVERHVIVRIAAGVMLLIAAAVSAETRWWTVVTDRVRSVASSGREPRPVPVEIDDSKPRGVGDLIVETTPPGARVLLDGKPRGVSPVTLTDLKPGKHKLVLESTAGTIRRDIIIRAGERAIAQETILPGFLTVHSRIPLEVSVGNRRIGSSDDGQLLLPPGRHRVTLRNDQFNYRDSATVDIEAGLVRAHNVTLPLGRVNIDAPAGAEVWIEGQRVGDGPLQDVPVPIGTREVVVKHPSFGERREFVEVLHNRATQVRPYIASPAAIPPGAPPKLLPLSRPKVKVG